MEWRSGSKCSIWDGRFVSGVVITSEARNLLLLVLQRPLMKQQVSPLARCGGGPGRDDSDAGEKRKAKSEKRRAPPLLYNRSFDAMRHASSTLKKIFADALHREGGDNAPLLAWPLVCGSKVAERTSAIGYADGVLTVEVPDATWQQQLHSFDPQYLAALRQMSAQPVNVIKFVVRNQAEQPSR